MTDKSLEREVNSYKRARKRRITWKRVVLILAGITVFWTTYMLILPAITMTNDDTAVCGFVDHKHDESCYEIQEKVLFSCLDELHRHSDSCLDEDENYICGYADYMIHTHGEDCYDKNNSLICTLPEIKEHEHSDDCYKTEDNLICDLEEGEEHQHSEECYESVKTLACNFDEPKYGEDITEAIFHEHTEECFEDDKLVCGQVEILSHTHSEACVTKETEEILICELPEHEHDMACFPKKSEEVKNYCDLDSHIHNEDCYKEGVLKCNLAEHTHSLICRSDPKADVETKDNWKASLRGLKLSGNYAKDVVDVAKTQLGYTESELNFNVVGEDTVKGYTRYGAWYGNPYDDWNAMFCSFCINFADIPEYPVGSDSEKWMADLKEAGFYHKASKYTPKAGDLVFFKTAADSAEGEEAEALQTRVGFVLEFNADSDETQTRLKTLEGDYHNRVSDVEYKSNEIEIIGYAQIADAKEEPNENEAPSPAANINISVDYVDDVIIFNARVDNEDIVVSDYNWQWQTSETGAKPWTNIKGAQGLFFTIKNTEENAKKFYRVVGSPKTEEEKQADPIEYSESSNSEEVVQMKSGKTPGVKLLSLTYETKNPDGTVNVTDLLKEQKAQNPVFTANTGDGSGMIVSAAVSPVLAPLAVGDGTGSVVTKPDYPPYITPSGSKQGETSVGVVPGHYWSDPATSQLENNVYFNDRPADDGKVLTDKSVIYGDDDYNAFSSYDPNTFGVTLSALGQKYSLTEEFEIKVPLDVVFVLDTSGSMINTTYGGVTSANIMVESLNNIMNTVLESNEDNRVGVVCYSGGTTKLLDLGRYTAPNDEYFLEGRCNNNTYELTPSNSIRNEAGNVPYRGVFDKGWYGTYTQAGIANGAQIFFDNNDTSVTKTVTKTTEDGVISATYTANRHPTIILLSDGEPTYCTEDYTNVLASTNIHGNGNTGFNNDGTQIANNSNNNKGVLGYYTILSAKYYKDQIAAHYNTDAYFYTIGIGIDSSGYDSYEKSVAGDDYKRATLNPTVSNITHLANCQNGVTLDSSITGTNRNISGKTSITCRMLYELLNNTYTGQSVTIGNHNLSTAQSYGLDRATTQNVPKINNPYLQTGYNYTDGAFFTSDLSVDMLTDAFTEAISFSDNFPVYGFILKNNTDLTVTDNIGEGMEIKGAPVLRVGGSNHTPVNVTTEGATQTYHYSGIFEAEDGSGQTIDLSHIKAEVTTINGNQTVRLVVADSMLPAYSPNLRVDGTSNFYYEALPVRLIYQVGLTEESEEEIIAMDGTGNSRTFYTNTWSGGNDSYATFLPTSKNPYYKDNTYNKSPLVKTDNTTSTKPNAWSYSPASSAQSVGEILGNNGKLTFVAEKYTTIPFTIYKDDDAGVPITNDFATFELYTDPQLTNLAGEYSTDATGKLTIPNLRTNRTYYLKETKAPIGYALDQTIRSFTLDEDGVVTGMNPQNSIYFAFDPDDNLHVRNDYAKISKRVEKQWVGNLPAGVSHPSSVQVQLYADGVETRGPQTLNQSNGWSYTWTDLPVISLTDKHVIEYTVEELNVPSDYVLHTETDEDGNLVFYNQRQRYTSLSTYKKWQGSSANSVQVELLANENPTGNYVTLNQANGWYHMWEDLPVYGTEGEISYSVREIPLVGYNSEVRHWTGPGDPYGVTETESRVAQTSLTNNSRYILTYRYNNVTYCLATNSANNQLAAVQYNANTPVTDNMLWTAGGSGTARTLTNVAANRRLVMNNSNRIALGTTGRLTSWTVTAVSGGIRLSGTYNYRTYYFAVTNITGGIGNTATTTGSAVTITPYLYTHTSVEDSPAKGDEHYIIMNTPDTTTGSINLSFNKISSEDSTIALSGAEFAIYRETGVSTDTLIPATSDRYGVFVDDWTTNGQPQIITLSQNGVYYLVETQAPEGYEPLTQPIVFEVTSNSGTRSAHIVRHPTLENGTGFTIMDIPNPARIYPKMPSTGGLGTTWIYMLGVSIMTAAVYMFIRRRKKETA